MGWDICLYFLIKMYNSSLPKTEIVILSLWYEVFDISYILYLISPGCPYMFRDRQLPIPKWRTLRLVHSMKWCCIPFTVMSLISLRSSATRELQAKLYTVCDLYLFKRIYFRTWHYNLLNRLPDNVKIMFLCQLEVWFLIDYIPSTSSNVDKLSCIVNYEL